MAPSRSSRARGFRILTFLGAAVVAVAAPGCTSKMKTAVVVPGPTINIVSGAFNKGMMAFAPDTITVHLNDTVRMHNGDSILHDIEPLSAGGPVWGSISGGSNSDVQATTLGTFHYVCAIGGHTMSGVLIVAP